MSPQLSQGLAAIARSIDAGGEVTVRWTRELERELLDICEDHDNSERDLHGVHVLWDEVAGWRVRLVGCYGPVKSSLTPLEFTALAMADAAMPYIGDWKLALERANNLAGALDFSTDAEADCAEALRHRIKHFGLRVGDVAACAKDMARAWRRATASIVQVAS